MTTPSGTISASDVNVELSKNSTAQLSFDDSDVRALSGVPSGQVSFNDLRGKSSVIIILTNASYYAYNTYQSASCGIRINTSGYVQSIENGLYTNRYMWCSNPSITNQYEVLATETSTNVGASGTFGTWLDCSASHQWQVFDHTGGARDEFSQNYSSILLQIRKKATTTISASATVAIEAERIF